VESPAPSAYVVYSHPFLPTLRETSAGTKFNCTIYDDDFFYTAAVCGQFDSVLCDGTDDDVMAMTTTTDDFSTASCFGSYWCNVFCSTACDAGEGAICMYDLVSDLATTCAKVASLEGTDGAAAKAKVYGGGGVAKSAALKRIDAAKSTATATLGQGLLDPNPNGRTHPADLAANLAVAASSANGPPIKQLEGHGLDYSQHDDGCAMHSYCEFCTGDCYSDTVQNYINARYVREIPFFVLRFLFEK